MLNVEIYHRTAYRYARPVHLSPHRMMLRPKGSHDLRVLSTALTCSPPAEIVWSQDVFGNLIATATFAEPTVELVIVAEARVEQMAAEWPIFRISPVAHLYPFSYSEGEIIDLGAMRVASPSSEGSAVAVWVQSFLDKMPTDTLSLLKEINGHIGRRIHYRIRDEEGTQTAQETLRLASGSCRDIAALFLDAVRRLGFGARAVSGYLLDAGALASDRGSTHAWADVYLPGAGWITFDPTHQRTGGAHLIPVGVGRANAQIMPISGGYVGAPGDFTGMDVDVRVVPVG